MISKCKSCGCDVYYTNGSDAEDYCFFCDPQGEDPDIDSLDGFGFLEWDFRYLGISQGDYYR